MKNTKDWMEYIVDYTYRNYKQRKIVIWGFYIDAFKIANLLKEKYGIETAFYVDSNHKLVDNQKCYPTSFLKDGAKEYYIIIPIGYYDSIKNSLLEWGYDEEDYIYFCDCIIEKRDDYYEDKHGNKIIGNYKNLKVIFSGYNNTITIGKECSFERTVFYLYSNNNVTIGEECCFSNVKLSMKNNNKISCEDKVEFQDDSLHMWDYNEWFIGSEAILNYDGVCSIGSSNKIDFGSEVKFQDVGLNIENHNEWLVGRKTSFRHGDIYFGDYVVTKWGERNCLVGNWSMQGYCNIKIGNDVTMVGGKYIESSQVWISKYTTYEVGNDCLISSGFTVLTNDCHSIFNIETKENINSSKQIASSKKVVLGDHVWIGNRVTLLYGTQIGNGSMIGASSLVKKKFPNNCIIAGNPAKLIRKNIAWSNQNCMDNIETCGVEYINKTIELQD